MIFMAAEPPCPEMLTWITPSVTKKSFDVLEGKKMSKKHHNDPFMENMYGGYYKLSPQQVQKNIYRQKSMHGLSMAIGLLHQQTMGSLPGWKSFPKGLDLRSTNGTSVAEVKNNIHTMNAKSKQREIQILKKEQKLGKKTYFIIVNGGIRNFIDKDGIEWISGADFYAKYSGRKHFFNELKDTVTWLFRNFKTYKSYKAFYEQYFEEEYYEEEAEEEEYYEEEAEEEEYYEEEAEEEDTEMDMCD